MRRLFLRRIPTSLSLEAVDTSTSLVEDCCSAAAQSENETLRLTLHASDQVLVNTSKALIKLLGIKPTLTEPNGNIRSLIESAADQSCTFVGSGTEGVANEDSFAEMSSALIASGLFVRVHEEINMDAAHLAGFVSESNLLIRSVDGKARIIDPQAIKQSISAKVRKLQTSSPTAKDIKSRADATESAQMAHFGVYTSNQTSGRKERLIMVGSYLDRSVSFDFSSAEDVITNFLKFVASSGAGVDRLARLILIARTPAIAALIANKFRAATNKGWAGSIMAPDTVLGWGPDATVMSAIFSQLNVGIISLKNFPTVEFAQVIDA